jgi:hypothetical protein
MNLSIIRSGRPHAGIVFGAVEKRPGPIGILPGLRARPKRNRVERSAALLLGCDPGNLALRRCGTRGGGVSRPASVPRRAPHATEGDLRKPNRGWRPSGTGLRPHEPKSIPVCNRQLHYCDRVHSTWYGDQKQAECYFCFLLASAGQNATCGHVPVMTKHKPRSPGTQLRAGTGRSSIREIRRMIGTRTNAQSRERPA